MKKQEAFNYAHTLLSAIDDVETFRNSRQNKQERAKVAKLAEQGDCE